MRNFLRIILIILIVFFLVFSPSLILKGLDRSVYTLRQEKKDRSYKGLISLWHIVSFKTAEQSGYSLLSTRAGVFEKQNAFTYIKLFAMTAEEAKERLASGEKPDIVSFPLGFFADNELTAFKSHAELLPAYSSLSETALPYMADSYRLAANSALFSANSISLPLTEDMTKDEFYSYASLLPNSFISASDTEGLCPSAALSYLSLEGDTELDFPLLHNIGTREDFVSGQSPLYLCPFSESTSLLNDKNASLLGLSFFKLSNYSDMVQMIGIFPQDDTAKLEMCETFCNSLLKGFVQKAVFSCGMLPVAKIESNTPALLDREEEYLHMGENAIIPKNDVLHFKNEKLQILAINALSSEDARLSLHSMLTK